MSQYLEVLFQACNYYGGQHLEQCLTAGGI